MSSWDEYPLAGRLRVEEPVGVFRLLEREAVGEKALERELAACNETRAFFLADSAERPRGVDRELPPEHVLADVERRLVAFAHEAHAPPGRGAAHGGDARVRVARAVHRRLDALAVGQRAERADGVGLLRVDHGIGGELAGEREPVGDDVERDAARARPPLYRDSTAAPR